MNKNKIKRGGWRSEKEETTQRDFGVNWTPTQDNATFYSLLWN